MSEEKSERFDPLAGLTDGERHAVKFVETMLDCFNGIGMMEGVSRYGVLEGRLAICATAGRKLTEFYGKLLVKMQWPVPPKRADEQILSLISTGDDVLERATLKALREQPAMVVQIARYVRDQEKPKRSGKSDYSEEWDGIFSELEEIPNPLEAGDAV